MSKTIWNPGDIITTEKWNRINNNASPILGAYQLPIEIGEPFEQQGDNIFNSYEITINKSLEEITNLLKQGIICYFYYQMPDPYQNNYFIAFAIGFIDFGNNEGFIHFQVPHYSSIITFYPSYENPNVMINYNDYPEEPAESTAEK